jgi:hypothetical protein
MFDLNKAFSNMLIDRLFKTNLVVTMRSVIQYQYVSNKKVFISVCSYLFCINWIDINLVGEFSSLKLHSFLTEVFSLVVAILQATNSRNLSLKLSQIYIQSVTVIRWQVYLQYWIIGKLPYIKKLLRKCKNKKFEAVYFKQKQK